MPKLSELLKAREDLLKLTPGMARDADLSLLDNLETIQKNINVRHLQMSDIREAVIEKHNMVDNLIERLHADIDKEVREFEPLCKKTNKDWVKAHSENSFDEWKEYTSRMYGIDDDFEKLTENRISANSNWQRPAMFFMPDMLSHVNQLFSSYPIYIFDRWAETEDIIKNTVAVQQARKIRFYVRGQRDFLPRNCLGFILARNYYTHEEIETLINDLKFFVELLGPGGTVAFNFNNCEISKSAFYFENKMRSFMLGREVRSSIWTAGLNITRWQYIDSVATTWVEATKPGEFKSIRKDEALGKIEEISKSKKKI